MSLGLSYLTEVEGDIMAEWRERSRLVMYRSDPEAWINDVLKKRWWSKQREIAQSVVDNVFTITKSCNGVGKTAIAADLVSWFVSVFPPEETRVVLSAPVREQINLMMFNYLRANYQQAIKVGNPLIGEITRAPKWLVTEPFDKDVVVPKRPADENLISSFQGIHDAHVFVVIDEAGGVPEDLWFGANAVTTNKHARILGIGNPDRLGTGFHKRFIDTDRFSSWNRITIGVEDTPNFTGEIIVPDDPEEDRRIKDMLVQREWAEEMRRSAPAGVVKAKVDGEFPDTDDTTFFDQSIIDKAQDTTIIADVLPVMGVDLAFEGTDFSVIYTNHGGRVRLFKKWGRDKGAEYINSARLVHEAAIDTQATEVRIDRSGAGAGVFSLLKTMPEFADRTYTLIGINGARKPTDSSRFFNRRAEHYWNFRRMIADGLIDLDFEDTTLKDQMVVQPYKINDKQQLVMLPKAEMKRQGMKSPDYLDAAIYASLDSTTEVESITAGMVPGDVLALDPWELAQMDTAGLPV